MMWTASSHALGRGRFNPASVRAGTGSLDISVNAATFTGGEAVSIQRYDVGRFSALLRTPRAPGSLSAFFLYERDAPHADEIDIEILNDDSRAILFTVWSAGREIAHERHVLPFDPAAGFHEYAIVRRAERIDFLVDRTVMCSCQGDDLPRATLDLRVSVWWPTWLEPVEGATGLLAVRRIRAD